MDCGAGISICDSFDDPVGGPTVRLEDIVSPQQLENIFDPMPILTLAENNPVSPMSIHNDDILDTALLSETQAASLRSLLSNFHSTGTLNRPSLVLDSGASISITDDLNDFISPPSPLNCPSHIEGIGKGLSVAGRGRVKWEVVDSNGVMAPLLTESFYCPKSPVKLFSPQSYLEYQASEGEGKFVLTREGGELQTPGGLVLHFGYHPLRKLPILHLVPKKLADEMKPEINLCVSAESNRNLTQKQREALLWHWKLGHCALRTVGKLSVDGVIKKGLGPACKELLCEACRLARAKKCSVGHREDVQVPTNRDTRRKIRENHLLPGQVVSMDQYQSTIRGRLTTTHGKEKVKDQFVGGTVFYDHASGYLNFIHQPTLGSADTVRSKMLFEQEVLQYGRKVGGYHTDNGVFTSKQFTDAIAHQQQGLRLSGVGAHWQNGVAERAIATIFERARSMMIHAAIKWPEASDATLWPLAVDYAVYIHNHLPSTSGYAPIEMMSGTKQDNYCLSSCRVWGCPAYVLDPTLQDGKKLPKWQPRARRGRFLGFSTRHASNVGLILNTNTGHISPQVHVVYDDQYQTVYSDSNAVPEVWDDLFQYNRVRVLDPLDDGSNVQLADEWLADSEGVARAPMHALPSLNPPTAEQIPAQSEVSSPRRRLIFDGEVDAPIVASQVRPSLAPPPAVGVGAETGTAASVDGAEEKPQQLRRSKRVNFGVPPSRLGHEGNVAVPHSPDVDLLPADDTLYPCTELSAYYNHFHALHFDVVDNTLMEDHPVAYAMKSADPDTMPWRKAKLQSDSEDFKQAAVKEFNELDSKDSWNIVPEDDLPDGVTVLPSTMVAKRKRFPDGTLRGHKVRFCVRGDMQVEGRDFFETYAPVVNMSTVRMVMTLAAKHGLCTKQVDYSNAFVQAKLDETVYVWLPSDIKVAGHDGRLALKLKKSLYGLRQAPLKWFEKLRGSLLERGFKQSAQDPCLFLSDKVVAVVWVDDVLWFARDEADIDKVIDSLKADFELKVEGDVSSFLGMEIINNSDGSFELRQSGLIKRILFAMGMEECNSTRTPADTKPLGADTHGRVCSRQDRWQYSSVVGMMLYLAGNTRPDIAFAVHQAARHTHNPRAVHEEALIKIARYLQGTKDKGLRFHPSDSNQPRLDAYCDADFAGLWGSEAADDPTCVKSRTGYVIMYEGCPVIWKSKLQSLIALSTMEAEYISLSMCMRDLIPLRRVLQDLCEVFDLGQAGVMAHSTVFEDNSAALTLANSPQMTPRSKHIALRYHFFRSEVASGNIKVVAISTAEQIADVFTKGVTFQKFEYLREKLMGW